MRRRGLEAPNGYRGPGPPGGAGRAARPPHLAAG
jgi:hypothetical protein